MILFFQLLIMYVDCTYFSQYCSINTNIMYTESRKEWDFYASLRDKVDGSGNDFAEDMQRVQSVPKMLS